MARSDAAWGIDIGQCSLKALRCRPHERPERIVAEVFDYIEYPKILSQPGADPAELISDALKQFLSRNSVRGDRVALTVPGQNGLARFIKLPPVESKKIPDIVRYEARQQIPFDLADVVWDYQRMGGGSEEEGFSLETEIGLFAMKREQVFRALEPLRSVGIEVDVVQLTPLALYNFIVFDQMPDLPTPDEYDPENPPASVVVLSLGTDATDLIVTNGFRVWQRSIPLGGSHFTKALTKELKLTFAKAEHLKRNATAAPDPKAVFQAMRPVFNDLLTEIQRSINFFNSLNRRATLEKVVALGNAMKLPGLRKYLSQSLQLPVVRLEGFQAMSGSQVLSAPAFKENQLSFGVCYGLALQAMGKSAVTTNLLPKEIVQDRVVREKKPWAVAAAAALMLASTVSFASLTRALTTVQNEQWPSAEDKSKQVQGTANKYKQGFEEAQTAFKATNEIGVHLMGNVEGRILWLELLKAINECLPSDPGKKRPAKIEDRNELYIQNVEAQKVDKLEDWFATMVRQ
ncbi:MAG: type IV pilus assembly protein PilM, partial [Planctomycetota bacterium]